MNTRSTLLAAALAGTLAAGPALADEPGKNWMSMDQVVKALGEAGYADVSELEADDGHWEGEAVKDGRVVEFHADPRTGAVTREKAKRESLGRDGVRGKDGEPGRSIDDD